METLRNVPDWLCARVCVGQRRNAAAADRPVIWWTGSWGDTYDLILTVRGAELAQSEFGRVSTRCAEADIQFDWNDRFCTVWIENQGILVATRPV